MDDAIDPVFENWENAGYHFTDLDKKTTGLPFVVWVSVSGDVKHVVRIRTSSRAI
jgi:hypothetical protein